ncbi:MAG: carbonic anhydrase, partial [Vicinamibacterales bacterium]
AEGQVTDKAVLASLERAATVKHVPLVVVMGHESCDLVRSAQDGDHGGGESGGHARETGGHARETGGHAPESGGHAREPGGNMEYLTKQVRPAVSRAATLPADVRLRGAILANVEEQINELLSSSEVVRRRVDSGQLAIVGAYYELASGLVHFSEFVKVAPALAEATGKH